MEKIRSKKLQKNIIFLLLLTPICCVCLMSSCVNFKMNSKELTKNENLFFVDKLWLCSLESGYLDCYDYSDTSTIKFGNGKLSILFTKAGFYQQGITLVDNEGLPYISLSIGKWQINNDTITYKLNRIPSSFNTKVEIINERNIHLIHLD